MNATVAPDSCSPVPLDVEHKTRRQFLEILGITAATIATIPVIDHLETAFSRILRMPRISSRIEAGPLSENARAYILSLSSLNLKHLNLDHLARAHFRVRDHISNSLPPAELWPNLHGTLKVAELLAQKLGDQSPYITSAYRTPQYNSKCPGAASNSQHLQNRALDLVFSSPPSHVAAVLRKLRSEGLFKGGVGQYPGFVHLDTRGHNVDW